MYISLRHLSPTRWKLHFEHALFYTIPFFAHGATSRVSLMSNPSFISHLRAQPLNSSPSLQHFWIVATHFKPNFFSDIWIRGSTCQRRRNCKGVTVIRKEYVCNIPRMSPLSGRYLLALSVQLKLPKPIILLVFLSGMLESTSTHESVLLFIIPQHKYLTTNATQSCLFLFVRIELAQNIVCASSAIFCFSNATKHPKNVQLCKNSTNDIVIF